jgi:hypothetical protein
MPEPRDPLLKVLTIVFIRTGNARCKRVLMIPTAGYPTEGEQMVLVKKGCEHVARRTAQQAGGRIHSRVWMVNDPSAGSPTERLYDKANALEAGVCSTVMELTPTCAILPLTFLKGPDHILSNPISGPPTTIWPVNSIHGTGDGALGLGCGLPISIPEGKSYLKLLPYPGLLARPRRGFPRALGVEVFRVFPQFDSVAC